MNDAIPVVGLRQMSHAAPGRSAAAVSSSDHCPIAKVAMHGADVISGKRQTPSPSSANAKRAIPAAPNTAVAACALSLATGSAITATGSGYLNAELKGNSPVG